MRKTQVLLLATLLVIASGALVFYKVTQLGLPLLPGEREPVWAIEAEIEFDGTSQAAVVDFALPGDLGPYILLDEFFVSRRYGLNIEEDKGFRHAEWSTRRASGRQRLYYRMEIAPRAVESHIAPDGAPPPAPRKPDYPEPLAPAIEQVLSDVRAESANIFTFASQLLVKLNDQAPDGNVLLIRENIERAAKPGSNASSTCSPGRASPRAWSAASCSRTVPATSPCCPGSRSTTANAGRGSTR